MEEAHALKVSTITLLSAHSHPHCGPLGMVDWLDDSWGLINQSQATVDMV